MEIKLIGTCYSHNWDGERSFRAIIGIENGYRLTRRKFEHELEAMAYGKRLFYRLVCTGRWEIVSEVKPPCEGRGRPEDVLLDDACARAQAEAYDGFPI